MSVDDFVTIASGSMAAGMVIQCIVILIGYAVFSVFKLFQGGNNL